MLATGHNRLVFSSTAACYGEPVTTPILEDAKLEPTNAYGESKLLVEHMLRWFNRVHGFRWAQACATSTLSRGRSRLGYGEAQLSRGITLDTAGAVLDVALGRRKKIKIFGSGITLDALTARSCDYIHVSDLADAHLLALAALETKDRVIYNIGNGQGFRLVREVIDSARLRVTGRPIPVEECPRRAGDPAVLVAGSEKIKL